MDKHCSSLLWEKIHAFITKTEVEVDDDYEQEIQQFEVDVKIFMFMNMVGQPFLHLRLANEIGSLEMSHSHIIRFNLAE